ncbi:glycosyltransferase family 2 protein [Enterobacter roggenkampii]|uniref:glycosyltransferase family 2 protein n=1 Tax=Enterobacter roggenkampii TaxID=1812935 RepID=UPI002021D678|nr:glycosyltransferase family 2 protein [Enterobacter roggenkampii]MCL8137856.1 glycosyltransferase family 2 protein [Enterobacter roggenkampii]MCM8147526.1 glycosyltransferase family 2 protein [Enterobacter roggenkampii]
MNLPTLGIVIPCFNEEAVLRETASRLIPLLVQMRNENLISEQSAIFFVDDGSRDKTWNLIEDLSAEFADICGIKLSRNQGHQNALLCGLMTAPGDILVSVDADLQDDLDVIPEMVRHYRRGCEIVYGVRRRRDTDTFFKRISAEGYYKLMAAMKVDIVFNHADYRLLSRRALDSLSEYNEVNLFLRGLVRLLGYKSEIVEYDRAERFAGESKYPLRKMLSFAWQGVTSFSTTPLRLITTVGIVVSFLSVAMGLWGLGTALLTEKALPGWTSTVVPMYFLGGVQLLSLGIIGEYVAKIYLETKGRPRFHVDELTGVAFRKNLNQQHVDCINENAT